MKTIPRLATLALLFLAGSGLSTAHAQGTAFTYQGRLNDGSAAANGGYDLRFVLYDNSTNGSQWGPTLTNSATAVSNGLFVVTLDFGNQFPGSNRWLEIAARTNGSGAFTTLSPRQSLTPTPYAITAGNVVSGGIPAGTYGSAVNFSNSADSFSGTFSGNGGGLTNVNAGTLGGLAAAGFWQLGGNTVAGGQFLGSLNNQPLELRANGIRGLRLDPAANLLTISNIVNVIGGSPANVVTPGVYGGTIACGGAQNYNVSPAANSVASDFGVVGGGGANQVQGNDFASTVAGGFDNVIQIGSYSSTIGGGSDNLIQSNSTYATIGGGNASMILSNASYSTISGGDNNIIQSGASGSSIGGGFNNQIQTGTSSATIAGGSGNGIAQASTYSTISGGYNNTMQGNITAAVIGGGQGNQVQTNANHSTIGGGYLNFIQAFNRYSTISGGGFNVIQAINQEATIGGGFNN